MITPEDVKRKEVSSVVPVELRPQTNSASTPPQDNQQLQTQNNRQPQNNDTPSDDTIGYMSMLGSRLAAQKQEADKKSARAAKLMQDASDKVARGRSAMSQFLQQQKPVYDEDRAKKLRKAALITALGNILSAAFGGVVASRGANYVAPINVEGAVAPLNELNRMQQEYQRKGEEWKNLEFAYKQKREQDEINDALSAAQRAQQEADKAEALYASQYDNYSRELRAEALRQDERRYKEQQADKAFERDKALIRERAKYRSSGGSGKSSKDDSGMSWDYAVGVTFGEIPEDSKGTQHRRGIEYDNEGNILTDNSFVTGDFDWSSLSKEQKLSLTQTATMEKLKKLISEHAELNRKTEQEALEELGAEWRLHKKANPGLTLKQFINSQY